MRFWTRVFTEFSENEIVVHDERYVDKVYAVLNLPSASESRIRAVAESERNRVSAILLRLDKHEGSSADLTREEREIFEVWQDVEGRHKFGEAASRVHGQRGLRNRFAEGIRVSRRYLPEMELVFREAGIPVELTRLPLIESCFNVTAYSYKGAAGIWQFMPATARVHGLRIDRLVDERRDPIRATRAAARYLAGSYRRLGNWPLAITAYNHGTEGIAKAARVVGSDDIVDVIDRYTGRAFGYAGQNFYAEFLAALEIEQNPERYFGQFTFSEPLPTDEIRTPHAAGLTVAADAAGVGHEELAALNPSLGKQIVRKGAHVPQGYHLRLPAGKGSKFERELAAPAAEPASLARASHREAGGGKEQSASQAVGSRVPSGRNGEMRYRIRPGETLSHIATRHGTTVTTLKRRNGIRDVRRLRAGQVIRVPGTDQGRGPVLASVSRAQQNGYIWHRVRQGQTLSHIAKKYGTSIHVLKSHNGIRDARRLRATQVIKVPTG